MVKHYGKFVSYLRVSTKRQGESGLGLEAQRAAVETWLNGGRWQLVEEFVEVESGKRADMPPRVAAPSRRRRCSTSARGWLTRALDRARVSTSPR